MAITPSVGARSLHHVEVAVAVSRSRWPLSNSVIHAAEIGLVAHLVGVDVGLYLLQGAFGHAHLNSVLLAVDRGQHFGFTGIELRALDAYIGVHLAQGVLAVVDLLGGLQLVDVPLIDSICVV